MTKQPIREVVRNISPIIKLTDEEAEAIGAKAMADASEITGGDGRNDEWAYQCALSMHRQKKALARPERFVCKKDGDAFVLCANPAYEAA